MWTVTFRRDWNDVQPRAEKRANKFAGCQVNVEREIREFTINVGAQEIFGRKGAVLGGLDCPGRVARQRRAGDPPEGGKMESDGSGAPGRTTVCHECGR